MSILNALTATQREALSQETLDNIVYQERLHMWRNEPSVPIAKSAEPGSPNFSTLRGKLDFIAQHGADGYAEALAAWRKDR